MKAKSDFCSKTNIGGRLKIEGATLRQPIAKFKEGMQIIAPLYNNKNLLNFIVFDNRHQSDMRVVLKV